MESIELKKLLKEIGESVHSMNTIAVALSYLPDKGKIKVPEGLDISWEPKNIKDSKFKSRNYAERSSYVYSAESLFEYLEGISKNPFWTYPDINFIGEEKKALKVFNFLNSIPDIDKEMAILCELLCHWRNRIVHMNISNASISSKKRDYLTEKRDAIYNKYNHFDIEQALDNFDNKRITLKDASTLITIVIKCARAIDKHFFQGISVDVSPNELIDAFKTDKSFHIIYKQADSTKRNRQLSRWLEVNYPYLTDVKKETILKLIKSP
ncbi:hypothetical protein [Zhouia amylolytica]|uniref:Uncharacterized protein n=1 Tax=Zhouia amylolytica AD3 TaxID=1286632 RepID=W2UU64_9FLAO|nr:hypothetical protein [Zhouia amylolytica]ETN96872.1 hypothetical protein P278_02980 [Zhouia amylolytica AD3]